MTRGQKYFKQLRVRRDFEVVLWVDKNYEKYKGTAYKICAPDEVRKIEYDVVLIAAKGHETARSIMDNAIALGVDEEKLVWVK